MNEEQALFALLAVFSFVLGSVVGSFLNVCVHRIPRSESVVKPRSRCPQCMNPIAWFDNIPLLSWLMLGAKCRHCGKPISWQYPLVEAITGALFLAVFWRFGFTLATFVYMVLTAGLVLSAFVDLSDWIIPDEVTLPGIPLGIGCAAVAMWYPESGLVVLGPLPDVFDALIGAVVGGLLLWLLNLLSLLILKKPGMGMGDVKLLAMLGAFFGWPGVFFIVAVAAFIGSAVGITAILMLRNQTDPEEGVEEPEDGISLRGHYLPFGPYLCLGGLAVMFAGTWAYDFYFAFLDIGP